MATDTRMGRSEMDYLERRRARKKASRNYAIPLGVLLATLAGGLAYGAWRALRIRAQRRGAPSSRHVSETAADYEHAAHRVLILGAGFGGLTVARELDRRLPATSNVSALVVDRNNSLLFAPLLWTVAEGRAAPNDVVVPIRAFQHGKRFHVLQAEVQAIDIENRLVHTSAGTRSYDMLVLALGSRTVIPNLPGVREHARVFGMPAHAVELRNRLIDAIEVAHNAQDPNERREWLTFVVSGGGDTGIELAAVISNYLHGGLFREYPWLADAPVRIVLVGRAGRLVPMSDAATSETVKRVLEQEGIEVLTGVSVQGVSDRGVQTSAGEIPARTVFWAAGVSAPPVVRAIPAEHAANGSLMVDDRLRLPTHPEVYVVGDSAWAFDGMTNAPIPPTAQAAEHMAAYVARQIADALAGRETPAFHFAPLGHLALLGRHTGVARIRRLMLTGMPAWLLWHAYYLSHLPSWRNRVQILLDWLVSALVGRETSELRLEPATDVTPAGESGVASAR
ncbi:MAG: NAD(P)/FAD-dependent oxidoreductase [Ktedonobacterales bacterium]